MDIRCKQEYENGKKKKYFRKLFYSFCLMLLFGKLTTQLKFIYKQQQQKTKMYIFSMALNSREWNKIKKYKKQENLSLYRRNCNITTLNWN